MSTTEPPRDLTVRELIDALAAYNEELPITALYDCGYASGGVVGGSRVTLVVY